MRLNRVVLLGLVTIAIIALDQTTKLAAFRTLNPYESRFLLGGVIEFREQRNPGAAFGILGNLPGSPAILTVTTVATLVLLAVLFRRYVRTHLVTGSLALGLIYGGAIGNGIDRVASGRVRDFIGLHLHYFDWPAFNVADIMIVVGIILLLVGLMLAPASRHSTEGGENAEHAQPGEPGVNETSAETAQGSREEA